MHQKGDAVIDSPDEGRRRVREMHKYGAEVIKICATGGVFSHGDTPGAQQLTLEEIKAMVDEAHRAGMRVAAHAAMAEGITAAILGGVDTIEHASLVDDEGIKLALQHGSYFGMDIYNTDYTQAEGKKNGVLEENLAEGPRHRRDPAPELQEGAEGRGEDDLLVGCGRLSARDQCAAVRGDGALWGDAPAGRSRPRRSPPPRRWTGSRTWARRPPATLATWWA